MDNVNIEGRGFNLIINVKTLMEEEEEEKEEGNFKGKNFISIYT